MVYTLIETSKDRENNLTFEVMIFDSEQDLIESETFYTLAQAEKWLADNYPESESL